MAKAESMSIVQFQKQFGTEEDCASYLMYKKWKDGYNVQNVIIKLIITFQRLNFMNVSIATTNLRLQQAHRCIKPSYPLQLGSGRSIS